MCCDVEQGPWGCTPCRQLSCSARCPQSCHWSRWVSPAPHITQRFRRWAFSGQCLGPIGLCCLWCCVAAAVATSSSKLLLLLSSQQLLLLLGTLRITCSSNTWILNTSSSAPAAIETTKAHNSSTKAGSRIEAIQPQEPQGRPPSDFSS